jgi:hypothetical protein
VSTTGNGVEGHGNMFVPVAHGVKAGEVSGDGDMAEASGGEAHEGRGIPAEGQGRSGAAGGAGSGDDTGLSVAQRLQLDLMRLATFNHFNGDRVVDDLLANRDLWLAALMMRPAGPSFDFIPNLIPLRDLSDGGWNVDTLYILARPGQKAALERLARAWQADELAWLEGEEAAQALGVSAQSDLQVLQLWWD